MKVEKKVSIQGGWIKAREDVKDGDIVLIASEAEKVQGDFGERLVVKIETKSKDVKNLSLNQTSVNNLIDAYGNETNEWQGEKVRVWIVKANVGGKMKDVVYLTAPGWTMDEDGFHQPNVKVEDEEEIPIINE